MQNIAIFNKDPRLLKEVGDLSLLPISLCDADNFILTLRTITTTITITRSDV
jgi:hypothetical protein